MIYLMGQSRGRACLAWRERVEASGGRKGSGELRGVGETGAKYEDRRNVYLDLLEIVVELAAILVRRVKLLCWRHRGPPRLLLFYRLRLRVPRSERHLTGGRAMRRQGQGRQMRRQVKNVIRAGSKTPSLS
jgi:hypothetical protein